jgi:fructokinase
MIQQGSEPTTLAVVALNEEKSADYTFYTQGTADRLFADPGPLPEETRILSLGTLGMVLEPGAGAYEHVLRRESARGTLTVVDPNIRAALIEDPEAYRARFDSWLKDIRLLKVSEDDARWLLGGEQDLAESDPDLTALAKSWLAKGVDAVVLTRGAAGLTVITDRETVSVPVPSPVPSSSVPSNSTPSSRALVDTIGAGDTVHGALLAWLHRHQVTSLRTLGSATLGSAQWRRILEYAAYAASITVSRSGAEPPTTKELEQRMAELA